MLLTQPSWDLFSHLTAGKNLTQKSCSEDLPFKNLFGVSALGERTKKYVRVFCTCICKCVFLSVGVHACKSNYVHVRVEEGYKEF